MPAVRWLLVSSTGLLMALGCPGADDGDPDQDLDQDRDGLTPAQGDCDDHDPHSYPGAPELCDGLGECDGDCDDTNPAVHPGAAEVCNGLDDDCDGGVDPGFDADGDGYTTCGADGVDGTDDDDCDDTDAAVDPSDADGDGFSTCDGDCDDSDAILDPVDADGDGFSSCDGDCHDADSSLNPSDADGDGFSSCAGDCDDDDAALHPADADGDGASTCDGDCDDGDAGFWPGSPWSCDEVVIAPAGVFQMGSPWGEVGRQEDESQHEVTLTRDVYIGVTEVTEGTFESVTGWNPSDYDGCGSDCPVERISWFDAAAFANELSIASGLAPCYELDDVQCEDGTQVGAAYTDCLVTSRGGIRWASVSVDAASVYDCPGYRLPTEAEWEYAARSAGAEYDPFAAGGGLLPDDEFECGGALALDDGSDLDDQAWYCGNAPDSTRPVASLAAGPLGLYDTGGNVWEWCHDYEDDYGGDEVDPDGPFLGTNRVIRGGSWESVPLSIRVANRHEAGPDVRTDSIGVRIARTVP